MGSTDCRNLSLDLSDPLFSNPSVGLPKEATIK